MIVSNLKITLNQITRMLVDYKCSMLQMRPTVQMDRGVIGTMKRQGKVIQRFLSAKGKAMEKVYDEQIAPKLMEIGKLCEENGIPFLAVAEYAPGKRGTTSILGSTPGLAMVILHLCSQTGENIDGFL